MADSLKVDCLLRGALPSDDVKSLDAFRGRMGDSLGESRKLILPLRLPLVSDNGEGSATSPADNFAVSAGETGHSADSFRS